MSRPSPARLSYAALTERAHDFSCEYWPEETIPVDIEDIADVRMGMHIVEQEGLERETGFKAFVNVLGSEIWVDSGISRHTVLNHYRFSIAHEVAHLVLHPEMLEHLRADGPEAWLELVDAIPERDAQWWEWQANSFAGLVLVPPNKLEESLRTAIGLAENSGMDVDLESDATRDHVAAFIGREFHVSSHVILRRGKYDGHWNSY